MTETPSGGMRGGARWMIPWAALVVVAIFAFMQLDAAQRARAKLAKLRDDVRALETLGAAETTEGETPRAALLLDDELAKEQAAHRTAKARVAELEQQVAAQRERADRNEALRATEKARADALEKLRADALEILAEARKLIGRGRALIHTEPVRRWLADAASGDKTRLAYAKACASKATPEQIEALRVLLIEDPMLYEEGARLAGALPAGPATTKLIGDFILGLPTNNLSGSLDDIGDERLLRIQILERVLADGSNVLRQHLLRRGIRHSDKWSAEERKTLTAALLGLLDSPDRHVRVSGAMGMAYYRLAGGAKRMAALLDHEAAGLRAAAAYGLSRVPDRNLVETEARKAVPRLLADEHLQVRTTGQLLAEALLGDPVEFNPQAPEAERAKAIVEIKKRLGL